MKNKQYNIVWLFVDGVRRYYSDDDRSKLKFMDEFAKNAVSFNNVVTSAPSTFMSLSAMMSGMPSYFINRNFDDFKFDKHKIRNLTSDLINNNYNVYSLLMHPSTRENMINIFPMVKNKYWARGLSHRKWWSNDDINKTLQKTLSMDYKTPSFFFVDYNCRLDYSTSSKVKLGYDYFLKAGFSSNNTITILCSDHGYPDSSKETGRPEYYKKNNLSHDLILTDDNIMIPMYIQYPGCKKGLEIDTTVSSIDLYPTILDLLNLPDNNDVIGKSWIPLIEDNNEVYINMMKNRFHRTDSRLAMQSGRGTSIRNNLYKYIFYHDNIRGGGNEEFFDIIRDPLEKNNLITSEDKIITLQIEKLKKEFHRSEHSFINYQIEYLLSIFKEKHKNLFLNKKNILIIDSAKSLYITIISNIIHRINKKHNLTIFQVENNYNNLDLNVNILQSTFEKWNDKNDLYIDKKFDIIVIPINYSENRNNKNVINFVKKISGKKLYIDYNLDNYKQPLFISQLKKIRSAWPFLKQEPYYCITYFLDKIKGGLKKLFLKNS